MAELVDAADSKSVFERSGSSSLPRGTMIEQETDLRVGFFVGGFWVLNGQTREGMRDGMALPVRRRAGHGRILMLLGKAPQFTDAFRAGTMPTPELNTA